MSVTIVGSVALDTIKTPFEERERVLGGSATHASKAASFFSSVNLIGVVGSDFPDEHRHFLEQSGIDLTGLKTVQGNTFHWRGFYEFDMNQAHTVDTQLGVFAAFDPVVPTAYRNSEFVFLANIDPELQLKVLQKIDHPTLVGLDSMNYWITTKREALLNVIAKVDIMFINEAEIRQLMNEPNLIKAGKLLLACGVKAVVIKKGEHGSLLLSEDEYFTIPAFPVETLCDPTGAGDTFAGGMMGYLASIKKIDKHSLRRAVAIGTIMASFNVEDFALDRLRSLKKNEIIERFDLFREFTRFETISASDW